MAASKDYFEVKLLVEMMALNLVSSTVALMELLMAGSLELAMEQPWADSMGEPSAVMLAALLAV